MDDDATETFTRLALSNQRRAASTLHRVCAFVADYVAFVERDESLRLVGPASVFSAVRLLGFFRRRGVTIPHLACYCIRTFAEELGVNISTYRPAVKASSVTKRTKLPNPPNPV